MRYLLILFVLVPLMLSSTVARLAATEEIAFTFNNETSITKSEVRDLVVALYVAVEDRDSEMLSTLLDDFWPLELQNAFFEGDELTRMELDWDFDPDALTEIRHYCFGAGAEDVPMSAWEVLDGVLELEGKDITYFNYPPHSDNMADLLGEVIFYPDTTYIDISLIFGIDASFKIWLVGEYYHGRYNGLELYFCHSIETDEWFLRSHCHY